MLKDAQLTKVMKLQDELHDALKSRGVDVNEDDLINELIQDFGVACMTYGSRKNRTEKGNSNGS